eukprot:402744-Rhodomonas_salina.1
MSNPDPSLRAMSRRGSNEGRESEGLRMGLREGGREGRGEERERERERGKRERGRQQVAVASVRSGHRRKRREGQNSLHSSIPLLFAVDGSVVAININKVTLYASIASRKRRWRAIEKSLLLSRNDDPNSFRRSSKTKQQSGGRASLTNLGARRGTQIERARSDQARRAGIVRGG